MESTHLVTGATGFLGSALVLELLRETSASVVCLARPAGDSSRARERMKRSLERAATASQQSHVLDRLQDRWRVVSGDILKPDCGVDEAKVGRVSCVWHVAASLRFEPELAPDIFRHNVEGTRNVLALADRIGAERFQYMSTAYVAGAREGSILEQLMPLDTPVNNAYEGSKVRAEHLVAQSGLDYRIYRPSIVIGYSKTASAAASESGFYGYVRRLARLRRVLQRRGELDKLALATLPGDPEAPLDLIPVDAVVHNAVSIARSPSRARIFHLTNASPPQVGAVARTLNRRLRIDGPSFQRDPSGEGPYAAKLAELMRFFLSYVAGGKTFDRSNTDAAIGAEASLWPLDADGVERYVDRFLEELRLAGRA